MSNEFEEELSLKGFRELFGFLEVKTLWELHDEVQNEDVAGTYREDEYYDAVESVKSAENHVANCTGKDLNSAQEQFRIAKEELAQLREEIMTPFFRIRDHFITMCKFFNIDTYSIENLYIEHGGSEEFEEFNYREYSDPIDIGALMKEAKQNLDIETEVY